MANSYEDVTAIGGESMQAEEQQKHELLQSRERFYSDVSLDRDPIFCGDDRESDLDLYIHVFGGMPPNIAYNLTIIREAHNAGSVEDTFGEEVGSITPVLIDVAHEKVGVHSDDNSEVNGIFDVNGQGDIGCGYIKLRQPISRLIAERKAEVLAEAKLQSPELFTSELDDQIAEGILSAHQSLSERAGFFKASSREVAKTTVDQGANTMVVVGPHGAEDGIINRRRDTSIKTNAASEAGLKTYDHDAWATGDTYDKIRDYYPFDKRELEIADLIDAIGTMWALGVKTIATRR
ncbi:MAG: hypothetical protein JWM81_804 [Candidatus Saccharibacteria bacterium]|nr:hypothetical protein [Candidatus Saccharibacteria bacterium]